MLLISSSIFPSSQVHVLFLPCSTGVLPEFFLSHLVLTGVVSNSILSIKLLVHVFATLVLVASLVPLILWSVSIPFVSVVAFLQLFNLSRFVVSLVCQRSNLVLPLLFLFRFPSGAILDLGTRSSRSGGVL